MTITPRGASRTDHGRLGGRLLAATKGDGGFTAFAPTGMSSMTFTGLAAVRGTWRTTGDSAERTLIGAH